MKHYVFNQKTMSPVRIRDICKLINIIDFSIKISLGMLESALTTYISLELPRRISLPRTPFSRVRSRLRPRRPSRGLDPRGKALVERFGQRGTEPNELFRSEFGQNSCKIQEFSLENSKNSEKNN